MLLCAALFFGCATLSATERDQLETKADHGDAEAQYELGFIYERGIGVPKSGIKAAEWYQKAAAQGNVSAQCSLGFMYEVGIGIPKDEARALEWYRKAAVQGEAFAQDRLGIMYFYGRGVPKNIVLAYTWLSLSPQKEITDASQLRDKLEQTLTPEQKVEAKKHSAELSAKIPKK